MAYREQTIRERAYFIWQHQGCPEGQALNHWLCAERERSVADEYPGLSLDGVAATVAAVEFYQANYDVVVNRAVSARGRKEFLGHEENDLPKVVEAIRWLRAGDLVTDRIDDGTKYTCLRSFTPGPAPFPVTRAVLLRRKRSDVLGPAFVFLLMFGNISFQIFLPAPSEDRHLIGRDIILRAVPVFSFQAKDSVKGPIRFWKADLSSVSAIEGPKSAVFHFDVATRTRGEP